MTDVALIASVATGASALLAGGVGTPVFLYRRKSAKKISDWHEEYTSWKEGLEHVVLNGVTPSQVHAEADDLIRVLCYSRLAPKGYEPSSSVRGDGYPFMGLTYVYNVDADLNNPIARYCYILKLGATDISVATEGLRNLRKTAALVELEDPWIHEYCKFVQEYAAHLLLNFRPTPYVDSKRDSKKDAEGMRRQKVLNARAVELNLQAQAIVENQASDTHKVMSSSLEAARSQIEANRTVAVATIVEPLAQPDEPARPSFSLTVPVGLLRPSEQSVVDAFIEQVGSLPKEHQVAGQQTVEKLVESATLASKAHHFSEATREQVLSIAEQNRTLAVSELEALTEFTAPAEEWEALHTLRVSNKYLVARQVEWSEVKQFA